MPFSFFSKRIPVKNHMSTSLELGFNQYGPTVALSGILMSTQKLLFIQNISLNIMRKGHKEQHLFEWFAFRPHKHDATRYNHIEFLTPSKFMISPQHSKKYNILFIDHNKYAEMNPILKRAKKSWRSVLESVPSESLKEKYELLYEEFLKKEATRKEIKDLHDLSYWEKGAYLMTIIISSQGAQHYEFKKSFELSEKDVEDLEENSALILADICKQPKVQYQLVYPSLQESA